MAREKKNAAQTKHIIQTGELEIEDTLTGMMAKRENKYLLVNVIARRSRDLNRGSKVLVELPHPHTFTELAREEVVKDKLQIEKKKGGKVLVNLVETE